MAEPILVGKAKDTDLHLLPKMANRHGLVAGATGTGKTVTLQKLAEGFSRIGVPVFLSDIKGDLSGISRIGSAENTKVAKRVEELGLKDTFEFSPCPVAFWDVFGEAGHPIRTTISEMGPLLLSRLLDLNEVQSGVLSITFKVADDNGLLLLDLKDLRAMMQHVSEHAKELTAEYGNVSAASVGAIQRGLLKLEEQGGDMFFGEPALNIMDFMQTGAKGRGIINILAADKLLQSPQLYATFLLWMLSELFEQLPEVGDLEKPKIVFFFDEAHLLFNDAPKSLLEKIEQVVRLIRSKGVGVYFVTQNPLDVPETVLAQLGNRVQHALRAFTPRDQKAVATAAQTFRQNPKLDVEEAITQLAVGEALVSFLDEKGTPGIVERVFVVPPGSMIGPITPEQRKAVIENSNAFGVYEKMIDRESAYEVLKGKVATDDGEKADAETAAKREAFEKKRADQQAADTAAAEAKAAKGGTKKDGIVMGMVKSAARSMGTAVVGVIKRGIMDTIFGKRGRR
jgi:uncharacterized protein